MVHHVFRGGRVPDEWVSVRVAVGPRFRLSEGSRYGAVLILLVCGVMSAIISSPSLPSALLTAGLQGAAVLVALSRPATSNVLQILLAGAVLTSVVLGRPGRLRHARRVRPRQCRVDSHPTADHR